MAIYKDVNSEAVRRFHRVERKLDPFFERLEAILRSLRQTLGFNIRDVIQSLRGWFLEVISCGLCLIALLAIVCTLVIHHDNPLPNWPYRISINALVSVFVVVIKTCSLFIAAEGLSQMKWLWFKNSRLMSDLSKLDKASRGPLGAIEMMWSFRSRSLRHLAAWVGAAIVLINLIMDPIAQQLLGYYSCPRPIEVSSDGSSDFVARVPRTSNYTVGTSDLTSFNGVSAYGTIDVSMRAAASSAISGNVKPPEFQCATGNCTFPSTLHTVGLCSQCLDQRDNYKWTCHDLETGLHCPDGYGSAAFTSHCFSPNCSVVASNSTVELSFSSDVFDIGEYPFSLRSLKGNVAKFELVAQDLYTNTGTVFLRDMLAINGPNTGCAASNDTNLQNCWNIVAAQCSLFPCVQEIAVDITSGNISETVVSEEPLGSLYEYPQIINESCIPGKLRNSISRENTTATVTGGWVQIDGNFNLDIYGQIPRECFYEISETAFWGLSNYFKRVLNGTLAASYDEFGIYTPSFGSDPEDVQIVYGSGNMTFESIDRTMANIAKAVTLQMRASGNMSSEAFVGSTYRLETCVSVSWSWLVVPIVTTILTVGFLIGIIIAQAHSDGGRERLWKSSALPLLLNGLDSEDREDIALEDRVDAMEQTAEQMEVQLIYDTGESGWRFTRSGGVKK